MVKIERKNIIIYSRLFKRTINRYFSVAFVLISLVFRSVISIYLLSLVMQIYW